MIKKINIRYINTTILLISLILIRCVSIPNSIQSNDLHPIEDLSVIHKDFKSYIGKEARFGGKVISITNYNNKTTIEISVVPLNKYNGSPLLNTSSMGRLYADLNYFVDPIDFNKSYITVVGIIKGIKLGKIGSSYIYKYVQLNITGYQRWYQQCFIRTPLYDMSLNYNYSWNFKNFNWHNYIKFNDPIDVTCMLNPMIK